MTKRTALIAGLLAALALVGTLAAGASNRSSAPSAKVAPPIPTLPPPAAFAGRVDNKFFPLKPGTTFRYRGQQDGKARVVTVFVTHKTKMIVGIRATVVLDQVFVAGKPEEKTFDWYAQDRRGNVWYLGEDSFDYVKGKWVRSDGSWQTGVDGAKAGFVMKAAPAVGKAYRQEYYAGHAEDMAKVIATDASVAVPYGTFAHALITSEWTPLEKGVVEHKYYVRGLGNVRTVMVKGGSEEERLVSVSK
ncbi:MAG: hypothetical protein H0W90_15790 [Actinobacteria bacterium]|nr:hypothetical protein [Actinomycetota bacterium]